MDNNIREKHVKDFFEGKGKLESICIITNTNYGIIPVASWFAKNNKASLYQSSLWNFFDSKGNEEVSIGAFILLAEISEENQTVSIEFARRALNIWCRRNFEDYKVLNYVFNRYPNSRDEWKSTLKKYNLYDEHIKALWGNETLELAVHFCLKMIEGEIKCKIEQLDNFFAPDLDQNLHKITKQVIGIVNQEDNISPHFINELTDAISNESFKLSTRIFSFQILTMKKLEKYINGKSFVSILRNASINAPFPLGTLLYSYSNKIIGTNDISTEPIKFKLVARSDKYMNEVYGEIEDEIWEEILNAYHTEIKKTHSLSDLAFPQGFSDDAIINDLLHKTELDSPIDPFELCEKLNILVKKVALPDKIEAFTFKSSSANKGMIVLNNNNRSAKRTNFTLAHEICHLLKHSFPKEGNILVDEYIEEIINNDKYNSQYVNLSWEKEANEFAHRLLIPTNSKEVKHLKGLHASFVENIINLSGKWKVSMSMLALKLISITDLEMVLIISENGDIIYSEYSHAWEEEKFLTWNSQVPDKSRTHDFIHIEKFASTVKPEITYLNVWNADTGDRDLSLKEEIFSTGYGKVFTLLYK
ncbi:ImmA/IrrE family metallo-endopeptidase [Sporosarcina sp. OR05]|uniref:ImmA/IrrE family metallo-endopeptidase n=1 Tax=Sporosarcina sp. OR05 TaxID=2969819 RepID=UPI00352BAFEC